MALYARVRGHTNDLSLEVFAEQSTDVPEDSVLQRQLAKELCERYEAALIIWFDSAALSGGRVLLRMLLKREHRYLERDLGPASWAAEQATVPSAALEAAAVIAREAIQAMPNAEAVPAQEEERDSTKPTPSTPVLAIGPPSLVELAGRAMGARASPLRLTGAVQLRPPAKPPAARSRAASNWAVGVGPSFIADGIGELKTSAGLVARVARRLSVVDIGADVGANLPRDIDSRYGNLRLLSGRLTFAGSVVISKGTVGVSLAMRAGIAFYRRINVKTESGVDGRGEATHVLGLLGPELRLRLPGSSNWIWTDLALGVFVPTHVLSVGYQVEGAFESVVTAWPVQPFVQFGIAIAP